MIVHPAEHSCVYTHNTQYNKHYMSVYLLLMLYTVANDVCVDVYLFIVHVNATLPKTLDLLQYSYSIVTLQFDLTGQYHKEVMLA